VARKPSPTAVGAFIIGGAILMVVAIIVWGSGRLFERRYQYVCYFPGSVFGLNVGAAVRYRGVPIGQVTGMRIRFEQPASDTRIPVFIEISEKRLRELGTGQQPASAVIPTLIDTGLRARLEMENLVTGQLYVNFDLFPATPVRLVHSQGRYREIPTIPTSLEEATRSLSGVLAQLREADIAGAARSLASAIEGINRLVNMPSISRTLRELPSTVTSIRELVEDTHGSLSRVGQELQSTVGARGPVMADLQRALVDVQRAAEAVRSLAEFLERNPNALIVGKKRQ
jgi:paraquat-inducible protein B